MIIRNTIFLFSIALFIGSVAACDSLSSPASSRGASNGDTVSTSYQGTDDSDSGSDYWRNWTVTVSQTICAAPVIDTEQQSLEGQFMTNEDSRFTGEYQFWDAQGDKILATKETSEGLFPALILLGTDNEEQNGGLKISDSTVPISPNVTRMKFIWTREGIRVLICENAGCKEGIFVSSGGDGIYTFEMVEGREIPGGAQMEGWTWLVEQDVLCAYGEGIFCWVNDFWQEMVSPSSGAVFRDLNGMYMGDEFFVFVAVGDNGRFGVYFNDTWYEQSLATEESLTAISEWEGDLLIVGTGGTFLYGTVDALEHCKVGEIDFRFMEGSLFLRSEEVSGRIEGVTQDGRYFFGDPFGEDGLRISHLPFETVRNMSVQCGSMITTESTIYNYSACPVE